jgi:multiple sugar transport system permease protein
LVGKSNPWYRLKKNVKRDISGWAILIPSLILFGFFIWQPLGFGIVLSFCETIGFRIKGFVGLTNYIEIFRDDVFIKALVNTAYYALWSLLTGYLVPIVIAVILNEITHLKSFFRFSIYFPNMVPAVATLMLWQFLFDPGQGLLNGLRASLGMAPSEWLQNVHLTIPLLILTLTWRSAGATAIIYIASLQGINQELYEAASLDGAGILKKLKYITIPGLFNIARLMLILQVIFVFQILYEPLIMTGGGPNNASLSMMLLNWNYAFRDVAASKASAIGVIVTLILILLTSVYLKFVKENEMS